MVLRLDGVDMEWDTDTEVGALTVGHCHSVEVHVVVSEALVVSIKHLMSM